MIDESKLQEAVRYIRRQTDCQPTVALILGSGLGDFADSLTVLKAITSADIPHYPKSTVQGHEGKLVFGHIVRGKRQSSPLLVFKGRVHYYETQSVPPIVFPVYVASRLGAKILLVTNAAGGINRSLKAGQLMLIRDILSLTFLKLIFPDGEGSKNKFEWPLDGRISNQIVFDEEIQNTIRESATNLGIDLKEGSYCWLKGPTYETASEIEMLRRMGADAVGMSTVPEVLAAKRLSMRVGGISLISNMATGITGEKLSHQEVTDTANRVKKSFTELMQDILLALPQ